MFTCYSGAHQTVCSQLFYTVLFEFVSVVFSVLHTEIRPRVPVNITMIWNHCYIRFQPETDDGNTRSVVHIKNSEMKEHSGGLHESLYWHRKAAECGEVDIIQLHISVLSIIIIICISTKPGLDSAADTDTVRPAGLLWSVLPGCTVGSLYSDSRLCRHEPSLSLRITFTSKGPKQTLELQLHESVRYILTY